MWNIPIPSLADIVAFIVIVGLGVSAGTYLLAKNAASQGVAIESTTRIVPEIKLVVKDNVVDTIYVYRKPAHP